MAAFINVPSVILKVGSFAPTHVTALKPDLSSGS